MRLLLIDDDVEQAIRLSDRLAQSGFVARHASSPDQVVAYDMAAGAAAVLLDRGRDTSPTGPIVQALRKARIDQPLIVLSARDDWREKVDCLDAGADDFLLKPVRSEEISARLRAIIRRSAGVPTDRIRLGGFDLDLKTRCAWLDGHCLNLTRNEFRLLRQFMLYPDSIHTHADVLDQLNPGRARPSANAVEVLIGRLRRKIGAERIVTLRGVGYRFEVDRTATGAEDRDPCLKTGTGCCAAGKDDADC